MRTGANTVHQTFTLEAASILKHSLSCARRRGHAQLTPLHVAATLLTSKTSVHLRRACLKSQPHQTPHYPLHCRALELSFNVALNRLPTVPYQHLHTQPSLSNALIAALKRAQAHQRRGFVEQRQQQPLLSMKVELKQLILSILDDPSVSRVLREVGFSSIAVKNNLECYSSFEPTPFHFFHQNKHPNSLITDSASVEEDIKLVLKVLLRKKRRNNTVIVGDSEVRTEGLVEELMSRVERKEVPEELKSAHLIRFQFSSLPLRFMKREEVEMNLLDLKRKVDSVVSRGMGVIIYIGDLKWTLDRTDYEKEGGGSSVYRAVDHLVAEMGRLVCEYSSSSSTMNVWLLGIASYQTCMKCQMKQPSLEIQLALQAVSVPSGGLGLSLHSTSVHDLRKNFSQNLSQMPETKPFINDEEQDKLVCCAECTSNYEKEARLFKSSHQTPSSLCLSSCNTKEFDECSTPLPNWLQSHNIRPQQKDDLAELRRKWNRMCHCFHQMNSTMKPDQCVNSLPRSEHHESCHSGLNFSNGNQKCRLADPNLNCLENTEAEEVKITLAFGNSVFLNRDKFAALGNEKFEVVPSIIEDLINSRSIKKDRWLLIEGNDSVEKRRLASEIGESMFGSADFLLFYMNMKNGDYTSTSSENLQSALRNHEKLVVVMEDVDFADMQLVKFVAGGFETGKLGEFSKEEESSCRAIFILIKGDPKSNEGDEKNPNSVMLMKLQVNETIPNLGRDSLDHKRKAEWDLADRAKSPRIDERDEASSIAADYGNSDKEFTGQVSSNTIDLNIRPDQDEVNRGSVGELSSISSD